MFTAFISKDDSWLPLIHLQMGLLALLSLVCLLRNKISYHFKITTLLLVAWLAYISELICFGPTAIVGMFGMLFVIIAMLFLRRRTTILLIALNIFSSSLIGISANHIGSYCQCHSQSNSTLLPTGYIYFGDLMALVW
jgi:hypothetical protein